MKVKFSNTNYVAHIKRSSKAVEKINNAKDDKEKATILLEILKVKKKKEEDRRNLFLEFMAAGIVFSLAQSTDVFKHPKLITNVISVFLGFSAVCGSISGIMQLKSNHTDKIIDDLTNIYKKCNMDDSKVENDNSFKKYK